MEVDWRWQFERGALVLRDPRGQVRVSIKLQRDGRWRWATRSEADFRYLLAEAIREALGSLELHPGVAFYLTDLADKAVEQSREKFGIDEAKASSQ